MPGGERFLTSRREEIFCYFDPGNRKPPLNVYFSGYKTREGFEGYNLMRGMGGPFLLISDSRLEGGAFYTGSEEYEADDLCAAEIHAGTGLRGTGRDPLGHFHGFYRRAVLRLRHPPPCGGGGQAAGQPGTIAANEKLIRPGGFPTSLDLLLTRKGT